MIPRVVLVVGMVLATAVVACIAPLWTYALSLALFGLPHVAAELRYVDERFGARLGAPTTHRLVFGVLAIAALRILGIAGTGDATERAVAELATGALLVAITMPMLRARGAAFALLGGILAALAAVAAWRSPLDAIVVLALLHNLTPVGFLAERLEGQSRRRALASCLVVFALIPAWIVSGALPGLLEQFGIPLLEVGPPRVGAIELHLGAFVPRSLRDDELGLDLFRAATFLQCMHYAVVLHVLPRLGGGTEAGAARMRWPAPSAFRMSIVAIGALFTCGFAIAFADTRAVYGVFAAIHAWIEIPVLLLACAVPALKPLATGTTPAAP